MEYSAFVDGWRGRIGLITPAPGSSTEAEFNQYCPEGVAVLTTRIPLFGISSEGILKMTSYVDDAAVMLAKNSMADLLIFSCTAGSFLKGAGYDIELIEHLQQLTGVKTTTTSTCIVEALKALGASSIAMATPYSEEINNMEKAYFEQSGYKVCSIIGPLLNHSSMVPRIPSRDMYKLAKEADSAGADVLFISCTGLHVLDIIEPLERDLGKPVITSNQCGLWGSLKGLGLNEKIDGLGKLFTL
jgi:maleate isomerase